MGMPSCIGVEIDLPSRARVISLAFLEHPTQLRSGLMVSPETDSIMSVDHLEEVPQLLAAPLTLTPLICPTDTTMRTQPNDAGLDEWCEGEQGRHGPGRSWFSTGIYLMAKGSYRHGLKIGHWIECDRFERCSEKLYE